MYTIVVIIIIIIIIITDISIAADSCDDMMMKL